ncbi:MAG TPA: TatD family hydrolase [Bacillales bacterium]|nr:TatD family hydrolase [Bacillales bacterium]
MIDAHLHLDQYPPEQLDRLVETWRQSGVEAVVAVSYDLASSYRTLELKQRYPDFVYAAVGHHPEQPVPNEADRNELFALVSCERDSIAAVGEIGIPHYSLEAGEEKRLGAALDLLEDFLKLAKRADLPVALHAVHDKVGLALERLEKAKVNQAHFHWLKADPKHLKTICDSGYFLSLTPEVCYRKRDQKLAVSVPEHLLLVETDGPWPFQGSFEGKMTTPLFLKDALEFMAALRGCAMHEMRETTVRNTKKLYGEFK